MNLLNIQRKSSYASGLHFWPSLLCFILLFAGCKKQIKTVAELDAKVKSEEPQLTKVVEKKEFKLSLVYRSTDAIMVREYQRYQQEKERMEKSSGQKESANAVLASLKSNIDKMRKNYDKSLYFVLTLGYLDGKRDIEYESMKSGYDNYSRWMQRLAYSMNRYIYLETPQVPEVPLAIYQMDRTFGITKDRSFLLVFPREFNNVNLLKEDWLRVNLREFGLDVGEVSFKFKLPFEVAETSNTIIL